MNQHWPPCAKLNDIFLHSFIKSVKSNLLASSNSLLKWCISNFCKHFCTTPLIEERWWLNALEGVFHTGGLGSNTRMHLWIFLYLKSISVFLPLARRWKYREETYMFRIDSETCKYPWFSCSGTLVKRLWRSEDQSLYLDSPSPESWSNYYRYLPRLPVMDVTGIYTVGWLMLIDLFAIISISVSGPKPQ